MRKKILAGVVCLTMVASMLAGCGDKKENTSSEKESIVNTVSTADTMKAFKEYYIEFCKENYTNDSMDCIGKVIYFEGQPMMVIQDCLPSDEDEIKYDIHFLAYDGKTVGEKYLINDLHVDGNGCLYVKDDAVYVVTETDYFGEHTSEGSTYNTLIYIIKDGKVDGYIRDIERTRNQRFNEETQQYVEEVEETISYYEMTKQGKGNTKAEIDEKAKAIVDQYDMYYADVHYNPEFSFIDYDFSLEDDDFCRYLDELAKLDSIDNNNQIRKVYCNYMEYIYADDIEIENTLCRYDKVMEEFGEHGNYKISICDVDNDGIPDAYISGEPSENGNIYLEDVSSDRLPYICVNRHGSEAYIYSSYVGEKGNTPVLAQYEALKNKFNEIGMYDTVEKAYEAYKK